MEGNVNLKAQEKGMYVFVVFAIIMTFLLFLVDKDTQGFEWMKNLGNWIAFAGYGFFMLLAQVVFAHFLRK